MCTSSTWADTFKVSTAVRCWSYFSKSDVKKHNYFIGISLKDETEKKCFIESKRLTFVGLRVVIELSSSQLEFAEFLARVFAVHPFLFPRVCNKKIM